MDFTKIMNEITGGLTGDCKKDIVYLNEKSEKYKNHPLSREILRAIGRLIYEIMPDKNRKVVSRFIQNNSYYIDAVLAEVNQRLIKKEIKEAENLLLKIIPDDEMYKNDQVSEYYSFENVLELVFYVEKFKPQKKIIIPPFPYNRIYQLYAYLMIEKGEFDSALEIIDVALKRNPLFIDIIFEKAEIYKMQKNMDGFLETTIQCIGLIYRRHYMARYFRNLGFYFIEKENWDEAICCYLASQEWQRSEMAQSQMFYILQRTGKAYKSDEYSNRNEILGKHNIPLEPDILWMGIAWAMGEDSFKKRNYGLAAFFYSVVYEFTRMKEAEIKIKQCESNCPDFKKRSQKTLQRH